MPIDISVVICTRNRAESLRQTLEYLVKADRQNLAVEVVVVDNASTDHTKAVALSFAHAFPVRCLHEAAPGKYRLLNCAIDAGGLGNIVAVIDDDMSPEETYFQAIAKACALHPEVDLFGGASHVVWPDSPVPAWAHDRRIRSWIYSVNDLGPDYQPLEPGGFYSGNNYWFRSRVLERLRFCKTEHGLGSEADFMLNLGDQGGKGIWGPGAQAAHRIQTALITEQDVLMRARKVGGSMAEIRLRPGRIHTKQAHYFRKHPLLLRGVCLAQTARWGLQLALSYLRFSHDSRFVAKVVATERLHNYLQLLRSSNQHEEYRPRFSMRAWLGVWGLELGVESAENAALFVLVHAL